jgi:hypothetical protein
MTPRFDLAMCCNTLDQSQAERHWKMQNAKRNFGLPYAVIIAFLGTRIFGEGEHSASDCPHRHYIAIYIDFSLPNIRILSNLCLPNERLRRLRLNLRGRVLALQSTTPTKKKVAFQSERDRRAAEREKAALILVRKRDTVN